MRYITESELRDCFSNGAPDSYEIPADAKLTPAARQYLMDLRLFKPGSGASEKVTVAAHRVNTINASTERKPEHMTHLTRTQMCCKTHPRIKLRGKLDSLEAELLIVMFEAPAKFTAPLEDALSLIRQTLASDVKEEPVLNWKLDGMTEDEIHRASHHPEELGFAGHITPSVENGRFSALLNRLRTMTRECELTAVRAYWHDGTMDRKDIVLALNRLSSYFYVLQLRAAAK